MSEVQVTRAPYGITRQGDNIDVYKVTNGDITLRAITYGARILSVETPDRDGVRENVVLGYADLEQYETDKSYFGSLVGRYANRLAKGRFELNGKQYQVPPNDGENSLHGGTQSFAQRVWSDREIEGGVEMTLVSPDGDMGFPGEVTVRCRYTLQGASVHCEIFASTDADTVVNLTNHSYFNLGGEGNGTILEHRVQLAASRFVPINSVQIPTGELAPVANTPFDFLEPRVVGERIDEPGNEQLANGRGYDHAFVLDGEAGSLHLAAIASDPKTGRTLTVQTTQPGVQFYTGNFLTGTTHASNGKVIERRGGLCLETQHLPDSPNQPSFPSTVLRPGKEFHEVTIFTFGVDARA